MTKTFVNTQIHDAVDRAEIMNKESFNNYMDKKKGWGRGLSMYVFVHAQGIKTVNAGGGGGSKNGKILF